MDVKQLITDYLKKEGVDTLFCDPATPIIETCAAAGIRPVLCRQERVGVDMALTGPLATAVIGINTGVQFIIGPVNSGGADTSKAVETADAGA